jgi:serine protease
MRIAPALVLACLLCVFAAPVALAADPLRGEQWGLDAIEADAAHATTTGSGAVVAVIDTGVLVSHEDLQGRLLPGRDFVGAEEDGTPQDGDGHGTHVTGIVVATKDNGKGVSGVAPGAQVLPIRVLGDDGSGTTQDVAEGIDYAVAQGVDVINLSLGGDAVSTLVGDDELYVAAINRAIRAGIVVVAAAGNDSLPICQQPTVDGRIVCVGSVDKRGSQSFFSSAGDIVAPGGSGMPVQGEDILSTYTDPSYFEIAGTSQATPHVAGVAALLVSAGVRGQPAVERLLATATDRGVAGPPLVNARQAVAGLSGGGGSGGGGAGGGGGTAGGSSPNGGRIALARRQRIRRVLRRGVRARCTAPGTGRCVVRIRARGRLVAAGSKRVSAGRTVTVVARVTRAGRRTLRRSRRLRAGVLADVPDAGRLSGRIVFVR